MCWCAVKKLLTHSVYAFGLDILKMYLHTKMNFPGQGFQKLQHYRQIDGCDWAYYDAAFAGGRMLNVSQSLNVWHWRKYTRLCLKGANGRWPIKSPGASSCSRVTSKASVCCHHQRVCFPALNEKFMYATGPAAGRRESTQHSECPCRLCQRSNSANMLYLSSVWHLLRTLLRKPLFQNLVLLDFLCCLDKFAEFCLQLPLKSD